MRGKSDTKTHYARPPQKAPDIRGLYVPGATISFRLAANLKKDDDDGENRMEDDDRMDADWEGETDRWDDDLIRLHHDDLIRPVRGDSLPSWQKRQPRESSLHQITTKSRGRGGLHHPAAVEEEFVRRPRPWRIAPATVF